jgi:PBP1b-binding outer membrane lipoprotein LpoB
MRLLIIASTILILSLAGCESKTETEITPTTTTETTTVTTPSVDTQAVEDAATDAAHATGTAMETAGQAIQDETRTDTK